MVKKTFDTVFFYLQVPRRLIHCSDGILEEYSTDEDESDEEEEYQFPDPVNMHCLVSGMGWGRGHCMLYRKLNILGYCL